MVLSLKHLTTHLEALGLVPRDPCLIEVDGGTQLLDHQCRMTLV